MRETFDERLAEQTEAKEQLEAKVARAAWWARWVTQPLLVLLLAALTWLLTTSQAPALQPAIGTALAQVEWAAVPVAGVAPAAQLPPPPPPPPPPLARPVPPQTQAVPSPAAPPAEPEAAVPAAPKQAVRPQPAAPLPAQATEAARLAAVDAEFGAPLCSASRKHGLSPVGWCV